MNVGQFIAQEGVYDPGGSGRIGNHRVRTIPKGVSCFCCMGGNCHAVEHVVDKCVCLCTPVFIDDFSPCLTDALAFKREYLSSQRRFGEIFMGRKIEDKVEGNGQDGLAKNNAHHPKDRENIIKRGRGGNEQDSDEEEVMGVFECRRIIGTMGGRCRVELGYCGRRWCGRCFQRGEQWRQGKPFIPENIQIQWICEFLQGFEKKKMEGRKVEEVNRVMEGKKYDKDKEMEGQTVDSGSLVEAGPDEECFGSQDMHFPVTRRPINYHRDLCGVEEDGWKEWLGESGVNVGHQLTMDQQDLVKRLLYTWKDVFVLDIAQLPATDLVMHTIPTYPDARPHRAKDPIYASDEIRWQNEVLPDWIDVILNACSSSWVAKTTWVEKKDTKIDPVTGER